MITQRDDEDKVEKACFLIVLGPFVAAFAMLGFSLAAISARFLFDIVSNAGRLP